MKQVTLWILVKTRRWKWLEELFARLPCRTLTLPLLLSYGRGLHEEKGVRRSFIRDTGARRAENEKRKDGRSRRLLPAELVEGQEVEALFMKVMSSSFSSRGLLDTTEARADGTVSMVIPGLEAHTRPAALEFPASHFVSLRGEEPTR